VALIEINDAALLAHLKRLEGQIPEAAGMALGQVALAIEAQAFVYASGPVVKKGPHVPWAGAGPNIRSGDLRRNIKASPAERTGFGSYKADVTSPMAYSRAVEEGTDRSGKYPFMRPAFDYISKQADQIFIKAYRRFRSI
jgi:HK97 gp10 family phage protein